MKTPNRWLTTITVMLITVIEILDMTIVVVAMQNMMGALSADQDQITWVITAYIVASAIIILFTGYLTARFGRKKLLLTAVVGFGISSALCGFSTNLSMLVAFRILQGLFGAVFVPSSQAVLKSTFNEKEQGIAMSIWGIGIMVAPVLGPTVGGYIVQHLDWRWIFFINIPVCILAFFMTTRYIVDTPKQQLPLDWLGIILVIIGVGALQMFLDQGNSHDWFNSHFIVILAVLAAVGLSFFIFHSLTDKNPIVHIRIFKNYNFTVSTIIIACFAASVLGAVTIQPLMMEHLMSYPAMTTGILLAPRALTSAIGMLFAGICMKKGTDPRWLVAIGLLVGAYGTWMMVDFNLAMGTRLIIVSALVQGLGMGLALVPLITFSTISINKAEISQATALFSFCRNLGNAIGVSILSTILFREGQINWNHFAGQLLPNDPNVEHWFAIQHTTPHNPVTLTQLANTVGAQTGMISFIDAYYASAILLICLLPFVCFLRPKG